MPISGDSRSLTLTDTHGFQTLTTYVNAERGVDCGHFRPSFVRRRLAYRMLARSVTTYPAYLGILREDPVELDALIAALSINVSRFKRDEKAFALLQQQVLMPEIAGRERDGIRRLSVWSAGCASGEEPYTIAIVLSELVGTGLSDWRIRIRASDLDERALEAARQGFYQAPCLQNLDESTIGRYFSRQGDGFLIDPDIRRMVAWHREDIRALDTRLHYDLVLCRNVLIYYGREQQRRIIDHLIGCLTPGGYLMLGLAETFTTQVLTPLCVVDSCLRIYRKPAGRRYS